MKEKFSAYLLVQDMGSYNMFDPRARALAQEFCEDEITREDWVFMISNYSELLNEHEE